MSEGNGYISLDALTAKREVSEVDVDVPALGGKVRLRGMTVSQKTRFERSVQGSKRGQIRERLLVSTIIKPEGITEKHIRELSAQDCRIVEPIVDAALDLVGMGAPDLEKLEGNSEETAG